MLCAGWAVQPGADGYNSGMVGGSTKNTQSGVSLTTLLPSTASPYAEEVGMSVLTPLHIQYLTAEL